MPDNAPMTPTKVSFKSPNVAFTMIAYTKQRKSIAKNPALSGIFLDPVASSRLQDDSSRQSIARSLLLPPILRAFCTKYPSRHA